MDTRRTKRILWLLNHSTLRDGEVPMLLRLGFEVYVPKIIPFDEANRSASVTYEYDASLSIPSDILKRLNRFNFYNTPWPESLKKEINLYFGTAIVAIFPKMVSAVSKGFQGPIFLRIFGLAGDSKYADLFKTLFSPEVYSHIRRGQGITMAASIANTIDNEPPWIQKRSLYLPQGLPLSFYQHEKQWRGDDRKVLFVCPRINSSPYYNRIYRNFKNTFGDLPHIIPGAQPIDVNDDPNVTGFLSQDEYIELFKSCRVLYYHSQEERHLHYQPIEAIVYGMPVIFMSGGVLEFLAREKLPGCCDTPEEARQKIQRILDGDEEFTREVIVSQRILLKEFGTQYVEDCWRERFVPHIEMHFATPLPEKGISKNASEIKHIGIWMHETHPDGFTGEGISRLLAMIIYGAQAHPNLQIHIAVVSWVKEAVLQYMEDLGVDPDRLSFVLVDNKPPLLFLLYNWWTQRKPKPRRPWAITGKLILALKKIRAGIVARFILMRADLGFYILILLGFLGLPFIALAGILFLFTYLVKMIAIGLIKLIRATKIPSYFSSKVRQTKDCIFSLAPRMYQRMVDAELASLAQKAGQDLKFAAWFFAYPNQKYLRYFNYPKIVAVPDIVYVDFPGKYSREIPGALETHVLSIAQTIREADHIVTFSEYVKQHHIVRRGYQPRDRITVIRHATIDTRRLISPRSGVNDEELRLLARRVIVSYLHKEAKNNNDAQSIYLRTLNLGDIDYLFISSQTRLHKNHFNLLKAYRYLLREKYINIKMVFTGNFSSEMQDYITRERLQLDVLSMHYMPPMVHAAFYACAKLTVVPTLFEGGFPFVFSESLSVNTPVVMSDIPVVREVLSESEQKLVCFDPYNIQDMADKIIWALENRSSLLDSETQIYAQMKARTWEDVAEDYVRLFLKVKKIRDN